MAVQSVEFDLDHMIGKIDRLQFLEVPYAASVAVNRVAVLAKDAIRAEMPRAFDRPVPFTLNSLYMKVSTKTNLEAEVGLRDFAPKGNPASKYLAPQIYGGPAYATRFQKSLRFRGILAPNRYAIPTQSDNLRVNQYGNVSPGMYTEILYKLKAFRDMSAFSYGKHSKVKRKGADIFAITERNTKSNLYPGIYDRRGIKNKEGALFYFGKTPQFIGKFPFHRIGSDVAANNWNKQFGNALAMALASRKF
jgi:hypothetical protein